MNANKKNNGWILCPSKTFPGKYYYFNVLNGETAWSLDDAEKKIIKKDGEIPKVTESHHHPEPSSPPIADPVVTTTVIGQPNFSLRQHPTPVFGQSVFPKVLPSKPEEPNVIWTPIQIQVPIVLAPESRIQTNQLPQVDNDKLSKHKIGVQTFDINKELYVHAGAKPLCQRFVNYKTPVINFDKDNKIKNKEQFDKFYTSTPIKRPNPKTCPTFKTVASNTNQMFQSKFNLSFSDLNPKTASQKPLIKESVFNIQLPSKIPEKVFDSTHEKLKQVEANVDTNKASNAMASLGPMPNNFSDDLRNILLAKKRKPYDVYSNTGGIESKKSKPLKDPPQTRKRVTFNLDYDSISSMEYDDEDDTFKEKYAATLQVLRDLATPEQRNNEWCLVVDAEVLLEEFTFLDRFVQIDGACRLVVCAGAARAASCAARSGGGRGGLGGGGGERVARARTLIRKLHSTHIIVETDDGERLKSPLNDSILKSCVEAIDRNIHVVLITNNQELQTTAKCNSIHCYSIQHIKNGLAIKQKESGYKQMKITIHNDTEPSFTQNGLAVDCYKKNIFGSEISNDIVKEDFLRNLKHDVNSNINGNLISNGAVVEKNTMIPNLKISNENSRISNVNSRISSANSRFSMTVNNNINSFESENECSRIYKQHSIIPNKNSTNAKYVNTNAIPRISNSNSISIDRTAIDLKNTAPIDWITNSTNANDNSRATNEKSKIPLDHSTMDITDTATINWITNSINENENYRISNENLRLTNENLRHLNESSMDFDKSWRYTPSDITATTIDVDMQNLNLRDKPYHHKTLEKNTTTLRTENKNSDETVSFYFQNQTPKFDYQKFKLPKKLTNSFQNNRERSFIFEQKQVPEQKSMPTLETETVKPLFETNQTKEFQDTTYEKKKENARLFEIDVFKQPQSIQNGPKKNDANIDLNRFYVKNKIMENRLNERMEEWVCTYMQIMEEYLSNILLKLAKAVFKTMSPPWSLYEALQCTKTVYKEHTYIKSIVDGICSCLYDTDCRYDKIKKKIIPSEIMKAVGYGIDLIQYLKKILQHSEDLTDSEDRLLVMMKHIEDPESDINEPLVKATVIPKTDNTEVRKNFVKNRTEIINYLKKHYPEWQAYDNTKMKIVRVYGKDLNLLRLDKVFTGIEYIDKLEKDSTTKSVADPTKNKLESTKTGKVAMQNFVDASKDVGSIATKNFENISITDTKSLECMIVVDTSPTKHVNDAESYELKRAKNKHVDMKKYSTKAEKLADKNVIKLTKTIDNNCVDSKTIDIYEKAKPIPKTNNIFDFIKPIDTRNHEKNRIKQISKLKIDRDMLAVKISVPNDYKDGNFPKNAQFHKEDNVTRKTTENKSVNEKYNDSTKEISIDKITVFNTDLKVIEERKNQEKANKNITKAIKSETDKGTGPKIIRNVNVIEEYEKRFESRRNNDSDEQDYSSINCSNDDDEIHYSNNHSDCNSNQKDINDLNDHSRKSNDLNDKPGNTKEYNINHKEISKASTINKVKNVNIIDNDLKKHLNNDFKNNEHKSEKDDMTNDSGFGNESPHVFSVVKSFSTELNRSLELIRRFVDGSLQEFRNGKIKQTTKKMFRLKAFEASFLITKIIIRLNKLVQKEMKGKNGEIREKLNKNIEAVINCIKQAQILHKVLNTMLTFTNEDGTLADLNSSMSLNLSS